MSFLPPSNLVSWLGRAQAVPRYSHVPPPPHVLDHLVIEPLICHVEDDLPSIGANMDSVNFNPDPPTYALR